MSQSLLDRHFGETKEAKEAGAGNYFCPGLFHLKLIRCELEETGGDGNQIWFRAHWRVLKFKGCRYTEWYLTDENLGAGRSVDSFGKYEAGQTVSSVYDYANKRYQGAISTIWVALLAGLPRFEKLSYDQIKEGMDKKDINKLISENAAEGVEMITEVSNPGMKKLPKKGGKPSSDFGKHQAWIPMVRYDGPKWWEDMAAAPTPAETPVTPEDDDV